MIRNRDSISVDDTLLGKTLDDLRTNSGTSAAEVAEECGVSQSLISGMRNEPGRKFDRVLVEKVEKGLGITLQIKSKAQSNDVHDEAEDSSSTVPLWIQNAKFIHDLVRSETKSLEADLSRIKLILLQAREDKNFPKYVSRINKKLAAFSDELNTFTGDTQRSGSDELALILEDFSTLNSGLLSLRSVLILSAYYQAYPSEILKKGSSTQSSFQVIEGKKPTIKTKP